MREKVLLCALLLCSAYAVAFNKPEEQAGPIHAALLGPEEITATDIPLAWELVVRNTGNQPITGTVRISVVAPWRLEKPLEESFSLNAGETKTWPFKAVAGQGVYNAWYPIHAWIACVQDGVAHEAHPILMVRSNTASPPVPQYDLPWTALSLPEAGQRSLARLPVHRVVQHLFNGEILASPVGWRGTDARTRAVVNPVGMRALPDARRALFVHPPWHGGQVGALSMVFPLALPDKEGIRFECAVAIEAQQPSEPPSDGVTFRVRALPLDAPDQEQGVLLFETHTDSKTWQPISVDLSVYRGQNICLQLETHPGPKNDLTCDRGLWGDPKIIVGNAADEVPRELAQPCSLGTLAYGDATCEALLSLGRRGLLDSRLTLKTDNESLTLEGFSVTVMEDALEAWDGNSTFLGVVREQETNPVRVRHQFRNSMGTFDLVGEIGIVEGKAIRVSFTLENEPTPRPWTITAIDDAALGLWNKKASHVYAGVGNVIHQPEAFTLHFDGHQLSSSFVGFDFSDKLSLVQATHTPPASLEVVPDTGIYTLHVPVQPVFYLIPATDVWQGVRTWRDLNGLQAAAGVERLAGRFVFDLWGGKYAESARELEQSFRYGLTNSVVVWHNWQRWGYDYRLPDIFPPNPQFGTLEEFQQLAQCCRDRDVIFAPHDNYIDFYPDAEGFSYDHIGFNKDGHPIWAWLNEYRGAQAFRWNVESYRPFLERNLALLRDAVAPTGFFIDVWSSIGPYDCWTHDGKFQDRLLHRRAWGESFAWIRDFLGNHAPQISESGHDQLIGYLDGAQTNHLRVDANPPGKDAWMVWRINCADAERIPWLDMAHHDRFVLHGAGYESRYCGGLRTDLHGIHSDDYISTEVLTGHPGMVPAPFDRSVVRKYYLLNDLMTQLALKSIENVSFVDQNIHRQEVAWQDGGIVRVNRGEEPWSVAGLQLPQYGFIAEAGPVSAAIAYQDRTIVEWSKTPDAWFVNARPVQFNGLPVRVALADLRLLENRTCEIVLEWQTSGPLSEDLSVYVHFMDAAEKIRFQADHRSQLPTSQWTGTQTTTARCVIPDDVSPGEALELRVGLWMPGDGRRPLRNSRYSDPSVRLASLNLEDKGDNTVSLKTTLLPDEAEPYLARMNPDSVPVDFGGVITNGACRIVKTDSGASLIPLPESEPFDVCIDLEKLPFGMTSVKEVKTEKRDGTVSSGLPTYKERLLLVHCEHEDFAYHLIK